MFNKLNRIRLRADPKELQGSETASRFILLPCSRFLLMECSPGFQRLRGDPLTCLAWFGSMVPIFWIVQQVFVFLSRTKDRTSGVP